jgi:hypothetical protein
VPTTIHKFKWISLQETCDYLEVTHHKVLGWINQRGMPASKVTKPRRSNSAVTDEWTKRAGPPMRGQK